MQPALPPSVCLVTAARPYLPGAKAPGEGSSLSVGGRPSTAPESPPGERGGKKRGSTLPVGQLSAASLRKVERSIASQREALLAVHGKATELLPRGHADFFTRMDATNVDDVPLAGLSQEDLAVICKGDGGRGTNRKAVRVYLRDRLARITKDEGADANEEEKDTKRKRGEFPYELPGLSDEERKAAWRKLLIIPGSSELAVGKNEFVKRTGGSGGCFWTDLHRERAAAMADEARRRGDVKTSVRQRTHTASSKCGR